MKNSRHKKIVEIVSRQAVETQEELAALLKKSGFCATQATISRDIRELKLMKIPTESGRQKYALMSQTEPLGQPENRFAHILPDAVVSLDTAQNLLVIKTNAGMAMAVAAAIDARMLPDIVGSLAGDDTVFCAVRTAEEAEHIRKQLEEEIRR